MLGSGAIIVADDTVSIPELALRTARFYHHESCGKCTPCREGTNWTVKMLERVVRGEATPMDLDIISSVQENIIGNCLCVLGDSMAMPVGLMVAKFRGEFEERRSDEAPRLVELDAPTAPAGSDAVHWRVRSRRAVGCASAPRSPWSSTGSRSPRPRGRCWSTPPSTATSRSRSSVTSRSSASRSAPAACAWSRSRGSRSSRPPARPRSATGWWSTPAPTACKEAQNAVVEFLLVNHPLDCPVCDKGGECPLQDIAMGWGPGEAASPTPSATSRSRSRSRRWSRSTASAASSATAACASARRSPRTSSSSSWSAGASTYVGTFDDRPYIAPFHGNIIELCPVGALTSEAYRFRARPWDIEDAGSICTLCPSQCNVKLTVRDERVERVLARDNPEVDDGWLCDKGRFGFQMAASEQRITQPMVRQGGALRPASWERGARGGGGGPAAGRRADGRDRRAAQTSNEEGYLAQRILRGALGSPHVESRSRAGSRPRWLRRAASLARALAARAERRRLRPRLRRVDPGHRLRPAARDADPRPADPQGGAAQRHPAGRRHRPPQRARRRRRGDGSLRARRRRPGSCGAGAARSGPTATSTAPGELGADAERIAGVLRPGSTVIVWGGRRRPSARCVDCAGASWTRSCLSRSRTAPTPAACARSDASRTPGPGSPRPPRAATPPGSATALAGGELDAAFLLNADPVRDFPGGPAWSEALAKANFVARGLDVRGRLDQARRRRLPGRVLRGEGGHGHPSRRPPPAPAPRRAPPRRRTARAGRCWSSSPPCSATRPGSTRRPRRSRRSLRGAVLRRHHPRGDRRPGRPLAGARGSIGVPARRRRGRRVPVHAAELPPLDPDPPETSRRRGLRRSASGHLPRPVGGRGHRPEPGAAVPGSRADARDRAGRRGAPGLAQGDEVDVRSNGTSLRARVAIRERVRPGQRRS